MEYKGKAESVASKIIEAFENGNVPKALATVFIKQAGRHADVYSWMNKMLVALNGYSDSMGYKQWQGAGRQVRKGEKGMYIIAPCFGKEEKDGETRSFIKGFTSVRVFGKEQTDIVNEKLWAKHNKGNEKAEQFLADLPLRGVAESWGLTLQAYSGKNARALGWYRRGAAIALGVENLATWAHELIHAADDKNGTLVESGQHWRSEVVAELGGAILMYVMGYETDSDLGGAYEYIKKYASTAKLDPIKACKNVLDRTCEAVAKILEQAELNDKNTSQEHDKVTSQEPVAA